MVLTNVKLLFVSLDFIHVFLMRISPFVDIGWVFMINIPQFFLCSDRAWIFENVIRLETVWVYI